MIDVHRLRRIQKYVSLIDGHNEIIQELVFQIIDGESELPPRVLYEESLLYRLLDSRDILDGSLIMRMSIDILMRNVDNKHVSKR